MYHQTRIDSCSYISSQRIPTLRIKEVPELLEIVIDEELGGPEVEPRIELVDD
jgi:hypothetical protein